MKGIEQGGKRMEDLTVKEIKSCPVFAQFTDEQVMEVIATFKQFTVILYDFYERNQQKKL